MRDTSFVSIDRCETYDQKELYPVLRRTCEEAQMPDVSGKSILVKPNILSDSKPEQCITTHPEIVRAVIRLLKEKGASCVYVGDSPGLHSSNFKGNNCQIGQICEEEGAIWVNFMDDPVIKRIDGTTHKLPMARIVDTVDYVFSVCKFKTHTLMYTTGATKNLFGTIPGLSKGKCHAMFPTKESFARLIVGIHETVKPAFAIMDAIIGMEGAGPANGKARPLNLILASGSCLAIDAAQAIIMGYKENDIPILNEARFRHLMPSRIVYPILKASEVVVPDFDRVAIRRTTNFFSKLIFPYLTRGLQNRHQKKEPAPQFNDDLCIRCQKCINICPAKALTMQLEADGTKHVVCDYDKCIRCYCCHEMCPVDAIKIHRKEQ